MTSAGLLVELGWVVGAAAAALLLTRPLRLPPVLVYLLAGLILGPVTGTLHPSPSLDLMGELGIALLLFLVGLELSPQALRDMGRSALLVGSLQVAVTTVLGYGLAMVLGFSTVEAAFLGLAVAFSSTVVVVKLLERTGQLGLSHGRLALGVLLVQDLVVAVVLTLLAGLGESASLEPGAVAVGVGRAFGGLGALLVVAAVSSRLVLPRVVAWLTPSSEGLLVWSLTWCFLFIVGAEALHLSVELGALLAGLTLAPTLVHGELRRRVEPLADLFLAVFFVILGAEIDPAAAGSRPLAVAALVALVLVAKPLVVAALARWPAREPVSTSVLAGSTLGQMSEFAFILTAAGVGTGLVDPDLMSIVGVAGLVSIAISSAVIQGQERLWRRWAPVADDGSRVATADPHARRDHVVVVGMNALGRELVEALRARGESVLAVDTDPAKLASVGGETLQGNVEHWSVMEAAGILDARLVVSALRIEDTNNLLALRCRAGGVPVAVHAFDASVRTQLEGLGVDFLMDSKRAGALRLREALVELEVLA